MPSWKKVITSGSSAALQSLTVTGGITGSLLGTSSWATNALTASFVTTAQTASYVLNAQSSSVANAVRISNSDTTATPQYIGFVGAQSGTSTLFTDIDLTYIPNTNTLNTTSSRAITSSFATNASTASYVLNAISASFASTASFVNTLNQSVLVTGSLTVGLTSTGASENTLTLGPSPAGGAGEGGQLGLNAQGGTYTSASFIDNWQNYFRILKGTNASSTALVAQWNLHNTQMQLPGYTSPTSLPGTVSGLLAFDSSGNIITTTTGSGGGGGGVTINNNVDNYIVTATGTTNTLNGESGLQYNGTSLSVTGQVTASGAITSTANGAMYFRGGDDAEFWDINVANTVGIYGQQNADRAGLKLGSSGPTLFGSASKFGIGTITPTSASLTVEGNVWATSFTGSLLGTASWANNATTASFVTTAQTASYVLQAVSSSFASTASFVTTAQTASFVTGSNVFGPFGSNSILSASYAVSSSRAVTSSYALTASYTVNPTVSGSISGADYIDFSTKYTIGTNAPTWKEGRLFYDSGSGGLAFYNWEQDVTLNIGQEQWLRARNQTGVTITNGSVVRLSSAIGDRPTVTLAQSTDQTNTFSTGNEIIGMATHDIEHGTDGFITTFGIVNGLDTSAFSAGDLLWVSQSAGQFTNVPPPVPFDKTFVGIVTRANVANGTVFMTPLTPIHFHDISSVSASVYQQGDLWMYRSGSAGLANAWINTKQLSGSYGITGSLTATDTIQIGTAVVDYASVNPTVSGLNTIFTQATGSFTSAFMKYTVSSGSNTRAGEFMTTWNGTNIVYTDTSTTDIGTTAGVSFTSAIVSSQLRVSASCTTAGWNIKTLSTFI